MASRGEAVPGDARDRVRKDWARRRRLPPHRAWRSMGRSDQATLSSLMPGAGAVGQVLIALRAARHGRPGWPWKCKQRTPVVRHAPRKSNFRVLQ